MLLGVIEVNPLLVLIVINGKVIQELSDLGVLFHLGKRFCLSLIVALLTTNKAGILLKTCIIRLSRGKGIEGNELFHAVAHAVLCLFAVPFVNQPSILLDQSYHILAGLLMLRLDNTTKIGQYLSFRNTDFCPFLILHILGLFLMAELVEIFLTLGIQNVYDTLHNAADEYAQSGFITVDTLQSIIGLGQKYVAYLIDENGQLVINEERIQAVIAARTQQMAIESSLAYVEALRMAKSEGDIATLNNLLYATEQATNATWGLVYANLALAGLDEDQYQAALRNINAIRAMADSAVQSIGKTVGGVTDELEEMQNGLNDILDYVMDM